MNLAKVAYQLTPEQRTERKAEQTARWNQQAHLQDPEWNKRDLHVRQLEGVRTNLGKEQQQDQRTKTLTNVQGAGGGALLGGLLSGGTRKLVNKPALLSGTKGALIGGAVGAIGSAIQNRPVNARMNERGHVLQNANKYYEYALEGKFDYEKDRGYNSLHKG